MAGSENAADNIPWLENVYSPKEVANKLGTPCLVKVVKGSEHEDFDVGHFLKLDFGIAIRKAAANFVSSDSNADDKNEILIPLGYSGKIKVVLKDAGTKLFTSVSDLIKDFPRFVQVEEEFTALEESSNTNIRVPKGSRLELKELIGHNLYCIYGSKTIVLTLKDVIKFRLLADDTIYTLQEVVDRLHLPQTVKFQDSEFQRVARLDLEEDNMKNVISDTVKLNRITNHEVVVGLLKPPSAGQGGGKKRVKQTLTLFPMVSRSVAEIEVKMVKDKTDKNYKSAMMRLFPQEVDRDLINKSLYVDLAKNVKMHLLTEKGWVKVKPKSKPKTPPVVETPPPIPPGRDQNTKSPSTPVKPSSPKETTKLKSLFGKKNTSTSPREEKTKKPSKNETEKQKRVTAPVESKPKPATPPHSRTPSPPPLPPPMAQRTPISEKEKPLEPPPVPPPLEDEPENYEEPITMAKLTASPKEAKNVLSPNENGSENYESLLSSSSGAHLYDDSDIYDTCMPEIDKEADKKKEKKDKDKKRTSWNPFKSKDKDKKAPKEPTTPEVEPVKELTEEEESFLPVVADSKKKDKSDNKKDKSNSKKDKAENNKKEKDKDNKKSTSLFGTLTRNQKPVGEVKPNSRGSTASISTPFVFTSLSYTELADRFRICELPELADMCEKEKLDGFLFNKFTDENLSKDPFNLSPLHLMKVAEIKEGWTPKH